MSFRDSEINATGDERKRLLSVQADNEDDVEIVAKRPQGTVHPPILFPCANFNLIFQPDD